MNSGSCSQISSSCNCPIVISLLSVYSRASAHNEGARVEQELTKSGIFTPIPSSLFRVRQWPQAK